MRRRYPITGRWKELAVFSLDQNLDGGFVEASDYLIHFIKETGIVRFWYLGYVAQK